MRRLFLGMLILGISASMAWATSITVSGNVSGVWNVDTVLVSGDIVVPSGQALQIMPGVRVLFNWWYTFTVNQGARFVAVGTAADSIRFAGNPIGVYWHGFRFRSVSDSSRIEFCSIKYSYSADVGQVERAGAIYLSHSNFTIAHNTFSLNWAVDGAGIDCDSSSNPTITDNVFTTNTGHYGGAIMCQHNSCPTISGNYISGNSAWHGGGIFCSYSSDPVISGNIISGNLASYNGGGIRCHYFSSPVITGNVISNNTAYLNYDQSQGGGIWCWWGAPVISHNLIINNTGNAAGGIWCYDNDPLISDNLISGNSAARYNGGGLVFVSSAPAEFQHNEITGNTAVMEAGGLYGDSTDFPMAMNTIFGNNSSNGGGLYGTGGSSSHLQNCILWADEPQEISLYANSLAAAGYSDLQDTLWPGLGNFSQYPAFVDTTYNDYRLLWGSPCIDSGNPDSLDPDGTRSDLGAFYFDQSNPVRVLLTPHQVPYLIPAGGGNMDFTLRLDNWTASPHTVTAWCNVTLPDSSVYGPVAGPVTVTVAAHTLLARVRTQTIPGYAPLGVYYYNAYAMVGSDTSRDSFMFGKLGDSGQAGMTTGWANTGADFAVERTADQNLLPFSFYLLPSIPNPFNPSTTIRYQLSASTPVQLTVHDVQGRLVATLADGWREAGTHEVTFDGSRLASGLYFVRMQAGEYMAVQKLVLLK